jgi:hypothetical protein
VNTTSRQAKSKVKKIVAKTSKMAGATTRQARRKVKKIVAKIETKKITSKGKNR